MSTNKWQKFCPPIPKSMFSEAQKAQFIDLVQSGSGRALALKEIGLGRQTLQNTLDADPKFAEDYEIAKQVPKQTLELFVWNRGLDDPELALKVLQRMDNIRAQKAKRKDDKAALGDHAGASSSPLTREDLKNLTEDELKTLDLLLRKAKQKPKTDDSESDGAEK